MTKRPGVMIYLDLIDSLSLYSNDELGQLFRAIIEYGATGSLPQLSDRALQVLWNSIKDKLDRDEEKYNQKVEKNREAGYASHDKDYAEYRKRAKAIGQTPREYNEWRMRRDLEWND